MTGRCCASLQEQLGNEYKLFLLEEQDPSQEERPVAVVLPLSAVQPQAPPVNEVREGRVLVLLV